MGHCHKVQSMGGLGIRKLFHLYRMGLAELNWILIEAKMKKWVLLLWRKYVDEPALFKIRKLVLKKKSRSMHQRALKNGLNLYTENIIRTPQVSLKLDSGGMTGPQRDRSHDPGSAPDMRITY